MWRLLYLNRTFRENAALGVLVVIVGWLAICLLIGLVALVVNLVT